MNLLDYLATEFAPFEEKPFNPVDSAVLSQFCMVRAEGVVPALRERSSFLDLGTIVENLLSPTRTAVRFADALRAELYPTMFTGLDPQMVKENLLALAASPRFRDMRVRDYLSLFDTDRQTQFAAMTFRLSDGTSYVAFRGTDSTVVGWKEDFNMTFLSPVPAQEEAAAYLDEVAELVPGELYVGGHSKGGNLAVYAAAMCSSAHRERITRVFSHDGPGFHREFCADEPYRRSMPIMDKTVPKSTMIGAVLSEAPDFSPTIVESDGISMFQHNPFLWMVDVDAAEFVRAEGYTASSRFFNATLDAWMDKYTLGERGRFVDALFDVIGVTGATHFSDIMADRKTNVPLMLKAIEGLDDDLQQFVKDVIVSFVKTATVERAADAASGIIDTFKSAHPAIGAIAQRVGDAESDTRS